MIAVRRLGVLLLLAVLIPAPAAAAAPAPSHVEGVLPDGSSYVIDVPAHWNGTVLLYSHGYVPDGAPNPAFNAPSDAVRSALLADGYAQIGSSYPETGWVVQRAIPAQLSTLDIFRTRFGTPRRAIAWGTSMGGMITTGLAERSGHSFAGTLAMCGLEQGAVANFNNTLDPLFALRTLLTPGSTTPLVALPDQATAFAAIGQLTAVLDAAQATPEGRARIALAAALHNIPAWTDAAQPRPAPGDHDAAQRNQFGVLHLTIYVGLSWRQEAEEHAGGNMSWNTRVDYARMLERSSIKNEVHALYDRAGLSLVDDLAQLAGASRISADPPAVRYMTENISFSGRLDKPMLTIHTTGDPLVPVQVEHAYADAVDNAHRSELLRQAYVDRGGHCSFTTGEMLAALSTLEKRISTHRWPDTRPEALNRLAADLDPVAAPAYVSYRPAPYPRPFNLTR